MLPFSPPRIDDKIVKAVEEALRSGWITTGPRTKLFEKRLTEYCGNKATLCVNSASSGLELILRWFGIGKGDEVILPAYTYCATANVIVHCGAKPVFADINEDYNLSERAIERAITSRTKVIIPVDIAGLPCNYDEISGLVRSTEIKAKFRASTKEQKQLGRILILSDAAHSLGAIYKGRKTGTQADITVFSFHAVKNLTTAEGGAVCLNLPAPFDNKSVYDYLCIKSLHGQTKDALSKTKKGNWKYDVTEAGYKYNMTDVQAAMGLAELERYDADMLSRRRQIFKLYSGLLSKYSWAHLPVFEDKSRRSCCHIYLLRIKGINEKTRDRIIEGIFNRDVSVNVHFIPVPMLSYYSKLGYKIKNYPQTKKNYSNTITLPVYYDLTNSQVMQVVKAVADSVKEIIDK